MMTRRQLQILLKKLAGNVASVKDVETKSGLIGQIKIQLQKCTKAFVYNASISKKNGIVGLALGGNIPVKPIVSQGQKALPGEFVLTKDAFKTLPDADMPTTLIHSMHRANDSQAQVHKDLHMITNVCCFLSILSIDFYSYCFKNISS